MSDRRAAVRRERKERLKAEKRKAPDAEIKRAAERGKLDGRTIAFCVIANLLYDLHGFRRKRIEIFLKKCNKEATRFDQEGLQFVLKSYADKLIAKINNADVVQKPKSIEEQIYLNTRDDFYVSSIALMLAVLNDDYGMASNMKNTGRLDTIMEYCTNEYIKLQLDPGKYTPEWYVEQTREKTGLSL